MANLEQSTSVEHAETTEKTPSERFDKIFSDGKNAPRVILNRWHFKKDIVWYNFFWKQILYYEDKMWKKVELFNRKTQRVTTLCKKWNDLYFRQTFTKISSAIQNATDSMNISDSFEKLWNDRIWQVLSKFETESKEMKNKYKSEQQKKFESKLELVSNEQEKQDQENADKILDDYLSMA